MMTDRPAAAPPLPAMPSRPARPLSPLELFRTIPKNSLGVFDEELYEKLFVARRYGLVTACFVSDPTAVKRVLVDNFDNYPRLPTLRRLFEVDIGTGTLSSEGETWARHRRVATPAVDPRAVRADVETLIGLAEAQGDELAKRAGRKPVDMDKVSGGLTARMLNAMWTGGDPAAMPVLDWLSKVPSKPRSIDIVPKPEWLLKLLVRRNRDPVRTAADATLRRLMDARRSPGYAGSRDLLWRLVHTADRQTGEPLCPEEARDEAASLIAAGDAATRALTWVFYLLALHPQVEARLHAEVDALLGGGPPTAGVLGSAPYLKRVLDEALRLYPPIPIMVRKARRADELCGMKVPRGAVIAVSPFVIHRHRALWRDPDAFDPDRFTDENKAGRPKLAYIPFAAGPRVCPGASVSAAVLTIAVLSLARRLRFRLASDRPVVPFGAITLGPKGGLPMTIERR